MKLCYNSLTETQKVINMSKNQVPAYDGTFPEFVDECMHDIFNALITGGTKAMKGAIYNCINQAAMIQKKGGWKQQ